jgi:hypothetical protein
MTRNFRRLFSDGRSTRLGVSAREEITGMPLYEVETESHIMIVWGKDAEEAQDTLYEYYPTEEILRIAKRPRNAWVISKAVLGISGKTDTSEMARECLSRAAGDKIHAIRLYIQETGVDLDEARRIIESNMAYGW